ncbi:carbohydrate ABC transporter substrate-binding protein, CUT1 family [Streptomyces sp. TLI_053]|nr:carbohydrate ABC transporter substrate-binding protein, CUT1 family [Streptomyces sp. TLI_053]
MRSPVPTSRPAAFRRALTCAAAALTVLVAGCSSGAGATKSDGSITSDANETLLVWTDPTRQAGFEQFQKAHPDIKMKIETYDGNALLTKMKLFNRTGKGWPDILFDGRTTRIAQWTDPSMDYAQPLDALVPQDVRAQFGSSNDPCTADGKLYCLRNDLAQTVLWYDKTLMDQFGYQVPKTWDEYRTLGERVAKEHPGYIIGSAGSQFSYYDYFWASGCPIQQVTGPKKVHIDLKDPRCTRVAELLDPLVKAGSVTGVGLFDPEMAQLGKQGKVLMLPGASWLGDFLFKPENLFATPNGRIAAAPYPSWQGETTNWSGSVGGGIYVVSRHSKNMKGAAEVVQWMTTSTDYQKTAPTYPAYGPAAKAWAERLAGDKFYAADPFPVMEQQSAKVNPVESPTSYDVEGAFTEVLVPSVRSGAGIAAALDALQTRLVNLAKADGYVVE